MLLPYLSLLKLFFREKPRLSYSHYWPDLPAPSWALPPPHLFHPFSHSSHPSHNPPTFNSSAPSSPLSPLITVALSPWAPGLDEMKTVSNNYSSSLFSCFLGSTPLSIPSAKPQQLIELFIKLVKSSSPWQITTLLGGAHYQNPTFVYTRNTECIIWTEWRFLQVCNLNFANSSLHTVVIKHDISPADCLAWPFRENCCCRSNVSFFWTQGWKL